MKITIVTTMRNEGAHALEWVAHHRAAGVTDFLVYLNDCDDETEALLGLLPGVTVVRQIATEKSPQWQALRAAWSHPVVTGADWAACIDCDEFINLGSGLRNIPHLIEQVGGDAVLLPWRLFGAGGHADISEAPVTERFTRAAAAEMPFPPIGSYFKTLFRRAGPFRQLGVHRPKQKNAERNGLPVIHNGSGSLVSQGLAANDNQIMDWGGVIKSDLVQLNHYSVKSAADFMVKRARGLPNHTKKPVDLTYWVERNFNHVEETSISAMRADTIAQEAKFLSIAGVNDLQEKCRAWHRAQFEAAIATPDGLKLYGRLLLADNSVVLPQERALALIEAYRSVHGGQ
ncbi:MAG: glycosyltransferase family 2 protein [Pseudomonadota bacterium]